MKKIIIDDFTGEVEYELGDEEFALLVRFEKRGEFLDAIARGEHAARKLLRELRARAERLDGLNSRHQQQALEI